MIIGIGETILDIIFKNDQPQAAVPGGSTFNAIISLGRAEVPCTIVTEVGDDHVGDLICSYLRDNGVDDSYVNRRPGAKSHVSLAFLDEKNDAQYQFYKDHAHVSISDNMPEFSAEDVVVFGSFFAVNPVIREQVLDMLQRAHDAGSVLYYDINFRASHIKDIPEIIGNIEENMRLSTIVRGSLEDFGYLYGIQDVNEVYSKRIYPLCSCFICTDGPRPTHLFTPQMHLQYEVAPVETVSTIGAGDNFNAGFIYGLLKSGKVGKASFAIMNEADWQPLIHSGLAFSAEVCASLSNSISREFAESLKD